jgi:hypothetical protein
VQTDFYVSAPECLPDEHIDYDELAGDVSRLAGIPPGLAIDVFFWELEYQRAQDRS